MSIPLFEHLEPLDFDFQLAVLDYFTIAHTDYHCRLTLVNMLSRRVVVSKKEDCLECIESFGYIQDLNLLFVISDSRPSGGISF